MPPVRSGRNEASLVQGTSDEYFLLTTTGSKVQNWLRLKLPEGCGASRPNPNWPRSSPRAATAAKRGCGRDGHYWPPPVQTRAGAANAHGSYLGFWRRSVHWGRGAGFGSQASGHRVFPGNAPMSTGSSDCAAVADAAKVAGLHAGTFSFAPDR